MDTFTFAISTDELIRMLLLAFASFIFSMVVLTPLFTHYAYKYEWWKKARTDSWSGGAATVYTKLHAAKHQRNIPNMAGLIFVSSIALVTLFFNLDRSETWLPLAGMLAAAVVGLFDDILNIKGSSKIAGLKASIKFGLYSVIAITGGLWFYFKNDIMSFSLPGFGEIEIGIAMVALFWLVVVATANSVNISDGLDGLAGGLLTSSFTTYALIAAIQGQYALAAFCLTVVGALLSYTWFNIYPARFFMGDVGSFALGTALGIIALQTDTVYLLPLIGFVYVMETGSVIINRLSRKLRNGKKVFLSSPIHHHFEALGWPETKVTMRFWVIGQVSSVIGLLVFLLDRSS